MKRLSGDNLQQLRVLFNVGTFGNLSDEQLLERFNNREGEAAELAFSALVKRHGPMVLRVCRAILRDEHDAQDAFQATFLVLVERAGSIRRRNSLASWLQGVALRVARRARSSSARRWVHERKAAERTPRSMEAPLLDDLGDVIQAEIARLPERYRSALILCDLEGRTEGQAADRLGCPIGTIRSRLARGRERLRKRLIGRGLAPSVVTLALLSQKSAKAVVPHRLAISTAAVAARLTAGGTTSGVIPASVAALAIPITKGMIMKKFLTIGTMLAALGGVGIGAAIGTGSPLIGPSSDQPTTSPAPSTTPQPKPAPAPIPEPPSLAEQFEKLKAEFEQKQSLCYEEVGKVETKAERDEIFRELKPNRVEYLQQALKLAQSEPEAPAARDALLWVLLLGDASEQEEPISDIYEAAVDLLVEHHANDRQVARNGINMDNTLSAPRDRLLRGVFERAEDREVKGTAALALGNYLAMKAKYVEFVQENRSDGPFTFLQSSYDDEGNEVLIEVPATPLETAYRFYLQDSNAEVLFEEAKKLLEIVIADYGEIPFTRSRDEERRVVSHGEWAENRLDEMLNLAVGKPAPEIEAIDIQGQMRRLSDYQGQVVALVFWGSWCGPCMRQIPREREIVEQFKDRPFALIGVNVDEDRADALKAIEKEEMNWPHWHDGSPGAGPIVQSYHIRSYPTIFVIDHKGIIRYNQMHTSYLPKAIEKLLEELEGEDQGPNDSEEK